MLLRDLDAYFRSIFEIETLARIDSSMNGIQVGDTTRDVSTVAFAVDACREVFLRASEAGAEVLFVHHGLYWGAPVPVTGYFFERMKCLIRKDLALYAVHLPLDKHPELGNNAGMADALGLESIEPFGTYKGTKIGCKGVLPAPVALDSILETLFTNADETLGVLRFGPSEITSVGIVSGGAAFEVAEAIAEGLDLYITGDASHTIYHQAMESGINVVFGGHYLTETWGVRRTADRLARETGLKTVYVDLPTGF